MAHHLVHFYDSDADLVASVSRYLAAGLGRGDTAIVFASSPHLAAFESGIRSLGTADAAAGLITFDAEVVLEQIFVDGKIDPARFDEVVADRVRLATLDGRNLRAYGELVELLWSRGAVAAAVELEALWDRLGEELPFQLFCAYSMPSLQADGDLDAFNAVCQLHTGVVSHGTDVGAEPHCALRAFPATAGAPRAARRFVIETAAGWGLELDGEVAVIVSELATNAVVHAHSPFTVTISSSGDQVRVVVRDESAGGPRGGEPSLLAESGRGLGLVDTLAARWGVRHLDGAKEIWAEVAS